MFKRIFAFLVLALALLGTQCWAQTGCGGELQPPCTGETIYISTFDGHQILKVVDAVNPTTTVVNTDSTKSPEDLVVGPDGKIYVSDSKTTTFVESIRAPSRWKRSTIFPRP